MFTPWKSYKHLAFVKQNFWKKTFKWTKITFNGFNSKVNQKSLPKKFGKVYKILQKPTATDIF